MPTLATVAAFGFPDLETAILLPLYRKLGCETVQFYRNTKNPPDSKDAIKITSDAGMHIDSIHGVFGPEYDPSSPDEKKRKQSEDIYKAEGDLASDLGGPMVVVHPAPAIGPDAQSNDELDIRRGQLEKTMQQLAKHGEQNSVIYLIENLPGDYAYGADPTALAQQIRQFNHPNIRMCFDVAHAHITSDVSLSLPDCLDVISYLHITDNDGCKDLHQTPGSGNLPFNKLTSSLDKLDKAIPAMLELFERPNAIERMIDQDMASKLAQWFALKSS